MSFSKEWEEIYKSGAQNSKWPWSDLVSLTCRYFKGNVSVSGRRQKVLELGCGTGANIPFFLSLDMDYYAVEGSKYQTEILNHRFRDNNVNIAASDFTKNIPFDCSFDLIVDRGAITCNSTVAVRNALDMVYEKLIEGGRFIGVDWFSDNHDLFHQKDAETEFIDENTHIFHKGEFSGLGMIHFFSEEQIYNILERFQILELSEKRIIRHIPEKGVCASWNLVAKKSAKNIELT